MAIPPATERSLLRHNPWIVGGKVGSWLRSRIPSPYVERRVSPDLARPVCVVVGPRQAGKSTLAWRALQSRGLPALLVNAEDVSVRTWLDSPALFVDDVERRLGLLPALFFEEVQHLTEAGLFLKGLADLRLGVPIVATGSSSFHLEARTRETLAGRADRILLLPFGLDEIEPVEGRAPMAAEQARRARVEAMAIYGGYPRVALGEAPAETLAGLVEAFVLRDASDRFRIQHVAAFRRVVELAARQIGNLVVVSEWAAIAGVSAATVNDYLQILEDTHAVRLLKPFLGGQRAEVTSARKAYFVDNGVRNQVFGGFSGLADRADAGALLENPVFSEIWQSVNPILDTASYWRTRSGAEMDFVVTHQGRLLAIEVKLGDARGRVTRSARSFVDAYQPDALLVANSERAPGTSLGATRVRFVRPEDIAGEVRAFTGQAWRAEEPGP